jgi:hypothetical protein
MAAAIPRASTKIGTWNEAQVIEMIHLGLFLFGEPGSQVLQGINNLEGCSRLVIER